MNLDLPFYVPLTFVLITVVTVWLFYQNVKRSCAAPKANRVLLIIILWGGAQAILASSGFYYENWTAIPPRFILMALPPVIFLVVLFRTSWGREFLDGLPLLGTTYLNTIRIPVEIVLYWLFLGGALPELATFSGRNFDILAGITAPFVAYFGIKKGKMSKTMLLAWNIICAGLLLFIVINAILSVPSPIQQFGFDQPNIAIAYFPFNFLPTIVVPIVMLGQFASIRQLMKK